MSYYPILHRLFWNMWQPEKQKLIYIYIYIDKSNEADDANHEISLSWVCN